MIAKVMEKRLKFVKLYSAFLALAHDKVISIIMNFCVDVLWESFFKIRSHFNDC